MKHYGKLTAAAAAGFMALSAMGVAPVFAEAGVAVNSVEVTKEVTFNHAKPGTDVNFGFSIDPVDGAPAGLSIGNATYSSTNGSKAIYKATLTVNPTKYTTPGVYSYTLTESALGTTNEYKGIEDTIESKTVKVYVTTTDGAAPIVEAITVANDEGQTGEENKLANTVFAADYTTKTLELTKAVKGNQANKNDSFVFNLTLSGATGEEYSWEVKNGTNVEDSGKGDKTGIQMKDGWVLTVNGLSDTDSYTITESNDGGYDSTDVTVNSGTATKNTKTVTNTLVYGERDVENVVFTNNKNGTIPTGILMTAAPYAALVGLGGIFAGFFFRRKRED